MSVERDDDVLLVAEVADLIRVPEGTLRSWRHEAKGPRSFKLGRRIGYLRSDVKAWLDKQRETTSRGDAA